MSTKPMQLQADIVLILRDGKIERIITQRSAKVKIIDFDETLVDLRAADVLSSVDEQLIDRYEQRIYERQRDDDKS